MYEHNPIGNSKLLSSMEKKIMDLDIDIEYEKILSKSSDLLRMMRTEVVRAKR